jgi:hypothetical protein
LPDHVIGDTSWVMAEQPAWWRRAFETVEGAVAPHLESLVRTDEYAWVAATLTWAQATVRHQLADTSAAVWHLVNLPAGSDVARLRAQVGALDREVRRLTLRLEHESPAPPGTTEAIDGRRTARVPAEHSRPHPPGRGTPRAPGP